MSEEEDDRLRLEALIGYPEVVYNRDDVISWMDYAFPENSDGSRDAGDHTIITADAWKRMIENYQLPSMDELAIRQRSQSRAYHDRLIEAYSLAFPDQARRVMVIRPRQYGSVVRSIIDEWRFSLWDDPQIRLNRLKDPEYLEDLKEKIIKGIVHEGNSTAEF